MPRPPGVLFPPQTISPPGSRHWLRAACSTPPTSAAGSTASSPRTRASPKAKSTGTASPKLAGGTNTIYFHGGETPGYNSKISYDPTNQMTLIVWTNLAVSLDDQQTANTLWVKVLDHIYAGIDRWHLRRWRPHPLVRILHDGPMHHYRSEESVESRNRGIFNYMLLSGLIGKLSESVGGQTL